MGRGLGLEVRNRKIERREVECDYVIGVSMISIVVRDFYFAI